MTIEAKKYHLIDQVIQMDANKLDELVDHIANINQRDEIIRELLTQSSEEVEKGNVKTHEEVMNKYKHL